MGEIPFKEIADVDEPHMSYFPGFKEMERQLIYTVNQLCIYRK